MFLRAVSLGATRENRRVVGLAGCGRAVLCGGDFNLPVQGVKNRFGCITFYRWNKGNNGPFVAPRNWKLVDPPTHPLL